MLALLVVLATLAVGYFNGANDVSKAIATLVGSGTTAVVWSNQTKPSYWSGRLE